MDETKRKRAVIIAIAVILGVTSIIAAANLMEYNRLKKEALELALEREELEYRVDELKYRLSTPIDDAYIEKMAREKLGLYFPDEIIYFNDTKH